LTEDTDNNEEINRIESLTSFLHEVEDDIKQNAQLLSAFEKISKRVLCCKKKLSENKLVSYIYQHANSSTVQSSSKIPVQVASVQRRKGGVSHSTKRRASEKSGRLPLKNKENEDPHEMKPKKKKNNNTKTT
ncbi:16767_t:CDS:2, partial [Gigaspora margarita]